MDYEEQGMYAEEQPDEKLKEATRQSLDSPLKENELTLEVGYSTPPPQRPPVRSTSSSAEPEEEPGKPPLSPRKLAANRANAQRSTGPKTKGGKDKSKFNAVKHGLTARYFANLLQAGTPEWEGFQNQRKDLFEYCAPVGPFEEMLVEKIAVETVRYARYLAREQALQGKNFWGAIMDGVRYQSAINRQLLDAIKELERVQAKREEEKTDEAMEEGESSG